MSLPLIPLKWYRTKLISDQKKEIKFRPFTVGEQKKIMIIKETAKKEVDIYKAIVDLTQNCIQDNNIMEMYSVDFEKLFYDIRSVADGNLIDFKVPCKNPECTEFNKKENMNKPKLTEQKVNTQDDFVLTNKDFEKNITINIEGSAKILTKFRQPKIKDILNVESRTYSSDEEKSLDAITYCLYSVMVGQEVNKDFTHDEATKFIDSLPQNYFMQLVDFYKEAPKLKCTKIFICEHCNGEFSLTNEEVRSFLA